MTDKFGKYWDECNLSMFLATVLDTKSKMKFINFCFLLIYQALEAYMYIDNVLSILHELYEVYVSVHNSSILQQIAEENASAKHKLINFILYLGSNTIAKDINRLYSPQYLSNLLATLASLILCSHSYLYTLYLVFILSSRP